MKRDLESNIEGPRGTRKGEFSRVMKLIDFVFRGSDCPSPSKQELYSILLNRDNLENMRIILVDGRPVSHLGIHEGEMIFYGHRIKVGSIGSVCTYPEYRGRGYATRLLEDAIQKLEADGVDIMLVSGDRDLYRRAGCAPASRMYNFRIGKDDLMRFADRDPIKLVPYGEEHVGCIIEAYQREPVRFHRSLEDFRRMLISGSDRNIGAETSVILSDTGFLGYLAVQPPVDAKVGNVIEYAGARYAIADAMKHVFDMYDLDGLNIYVPFYDKELIYLFRRKGIRSMPVNMPGYTVKIINFVGLMEKLRPYIEERLGRRAELLKFDREGDRCYIHLDRETLIVEDGDELAHLVFGTYDEREKEMMPKTGALKLLMEVFPLPLVYPGLNYV
jgi:GNAT superfamily N-acetyltransferase